MKRNHIRLSGLALLAGCLSCVAAIAASRVDALPEEKREDKSTLSAQRKIAAEDARYVLPNGCETQFVVTMNARSLKNFFRQRCCNRAQWEIRELARRMLLEVRKVSPALFREAGPACVSGPCPEGKMSCGRAAEMRKLYGEAGE